MLSTTKKFAKSVYAWITSKCCEDGISQPIKWEIFSVLPSTFPLLMWRFEFTSCSMSYIPPWATEESPEAGAALCMLGALHWSYNAQKPFYICIHIYILPENFWLKKKEEIYHLRYRFQLFASAWQFEMIENGSCLARKWHIWVGTELNATIGPLV